MCGGICAIFQYCIIILVFVFLVFTDLAVMRAIFTGARSNIILYIL